MDNFVLVCDSFVWLCSHGHVSGAATGGTRSNHFIYEQQGACFGRSYSKHGHKRTIVLCEAWCNCANELSALSNDC